MQDTLRQTSGETNHMRDGSRFGYMMVMVVAATTALIFSLMAGLSVPISLMLMAGAALLIGGILFTIIEILELRPKRSPRRRAPQRP